MHLENASVFTFQPDKIYKGLIWPSDPNVDYGTENLSDELPEDKDIDGYNGMLNGVANLWVADGCRIYPPVPFLSLNLSQNIAFDLERLGYERKNWALVDLFTGKEYENIEVEERVFRALEWHNRSTAKDITEEVALVNLAIAFECLLNLEQDKEIKRRFKETVLVLLGFVPRLDSWLDQFYEARSGLVHKGKLDSPMFYVSSEAMKSKVPKVQYRSLTMYGHIVFRLCLNVILSGARIAEKGGLSPAFFINNQERLLKICRQLGEAKESPVKLLLGISKDVLELETYHWESESLVETKTLVDAGRLALETYLATKPNLSEEAETVINSTLQQLRQKNGSEDEKLELFQRIVAIISQVQDQGQEVPASSPPYYTQESRGVVISLLNYITGPGFLLRKWYKQKPPKSTPLSEPSGNPDPSKQEDSKAVD